MRQRHGLPQGDLSRIRRQQVFLAATGEKLLSAGTLTNPSALGALLAVAQRCVVIDSGWDLLAFAPGGGRHREGRHRVRHHPDGGSVR